jgi:hypothetical protein
MSKKTFMAVVLLMLLSAMIMGAPHIKAVSKTIIVPDDYSTVAAAIGNSTEGDTIFVRNGTYEETTLAINKTILLIGEGFTSTTISLHPPWVPTGGYHLGNGTLEPDYGYDNPIKITAGNVKISGFTIISNASSLTRISGNGTQITGNYITTGLFLENAGQTVSGNIVKGGITCVGSDKTFSNNTLGYVWILASGVLVEGNVFSGDYGISIGGEGNIVVNNIVRDSKAALSFWAYAQGNTIYHNNFINNTVLMRTWGLSNLSVSRWDYGNISGGNYWDDYLSKFPNAKEIGNSGIGDVPYIVDGSNQDNYPLMSPFNISSKLPSLLQSPVHSVPEFQTWIILPLVIVVTLLAFRYSKKKQEPNTC